MDRKRVEQEQLERQLQALLHADCPDPLVLGEYRMNLLPAGQAAEVAAHVAGCLHCRAELGQLEDFWAQEEPPGIVEVILEWGRSLVQPAPALAFRGMAARAQTFDAGHLWLAVTVQQGEQGRKDLLALITREDGYPLEHGTAWLCSGTRLLQGGRVDGAGNLVIPGLEPGEYDLGIQCDGTRVWVRGVVV